MNTKRSDTYVFTADARSCDDMQRIELVKKAVKSINDTARSSYKFWSRRAEFNGTTPPAKPKIFRVRLMGRGPRKASYEHNVATGGNRVWAAYNSYLPQRYAQRFDIYIHEVYDR